MEFYTYWEPERWIGEREKDAAKLMGLSMFKSEMEILVVYANDPSAMFSISEESNGVACVTAFKLCWLMLIHVWVSCDISKNGKHRPQQS